MNLCQFVGWFTGKRVVEYRGKFIPQWRENIFEEWMGIDKHHDGRYEDYGIQLSDCGVDYYEEACAAFKPYLAHRKVIVDSNKKKIHCFKEFK